MLRDLIWKYPSMRWVGDGSELWRVRVDLFAPDREAARVAEAHHALQRELTESDDTATRPGEVAADQGTGIAGRPVIGLSFWVQPMTLDKPQESQSRPLAVLEPIAASVATYTTSS